MFFRLHLKWLTFFAGTALLLSCQNASKNNSKDATPPPYQLIEPVSFDFPQIKERGTLKVIVENSSTSYFLYKGKAMGYEYEMLKKLSDYLGIKLEIIVERDIEAAFELLNKGEADLIAYKLTITKERRKWVSFSDELYTVQQVLVQRKPDNWRELKLHEIERSLIRNPIDLAGKEVYVRKGSSYINRLKNLSEEIGNEIIIVEDFPDSDTENLIKKVAEKEIDLTISDDDIALVNASYYTNLDIETTISFPQQIAWAVRKNADSLKNTVNRWIKEEKKGADYYVIYNRYFKSPKGSLERARSEFSSISGTSILSYDELVKAAANEIGWDWQLLSALIFQESRFNPNAESWAGAVGLMQLMPNVAAEFGANNPRDPKQSIDAGCRYLTWLHNLWENRINDSDERIKFILASYNVGPGHVEDAIRLTEKYGGNPKTWDGEVEKYLELKSLPKYFSDEVVQYGYCRGAEPVNYVNNILYRFNQYKIFIPELVETKGIASLNTQ